MNRRPPSGPARPFRSLSISGERKPQGEAPRPELKTFRGMYIPARSEQDHGSGSKVEK